MNTKDFNEIYLNYAVYKNSKGEEYLVKVMGGYFASDAWQKGDSEYSNVVGSKFGGLFGDDGQVSHCNKYSIRRLTSLEEFEKLYADSCLLFKVMLKAFEALYKVHAQHRKEFEEQGIPTKITNEDGTCKFTSAGLQLIYEYQEIEEFEMCGSRWLQNIDKMKDEDWFIGLAEFLFKDCKRKANK